MENRVIAPYCEVYVIIQNADFVIKRGGGGCGSSDISVRTWFLVWRSPSERGGREGE